MNFTLVRMWGHLELPAPVAVGSILVVAALAKGGHALWGIGSIVAVHALFIVTKYILSSINEQRAAIENVPAVNRPGDRFVLAEAARSPSPAPPVLLSVPRPRGTPQTSFPQAA
jgi:hypothetical protein